MGMWGDWADSCINRMVDRARQVGIRKRLEFSKSLKSKVKKPTRADCYTQGWQDAVNFFEKEM